MNYDVFASGFHVIGIMYEPFPTVKQCTGRVLLRAWQSDRRKRLLDFIATL